MFFSDDTLWHKQARVFANVAHFQLSVIINTLVKISQSVCCYHEISAQSDILLHLTLDWQPQSYSHCFEQALAISREQTLQLIIPYYYNEARDKARKSFVVNTYVRLNSIFKKRVYVIHFITLKAEAKCDLLFNKLTSMLNKSSSLDTALGVNIFTTTIDINLVTLCCAAVFRFDLVDK